MWHLAQTRLGDWRDVRVRCELLSDTAPKEARIGHWKADSVRVLLYRAGLISYDLDSGLWYCPIFSPLEDYPEGWKSDAFLERAKRKADKESLGVEVAPKKKPSRVKAKGVKLSDFLDRPESL